MSENVNNLPYSFWSGNKSDTLNKWSINYKGSVNTTSGLPDKGEFKGDTYNVLEDGSNYVWNGENWDKFGANIYVGATNTKDGIQGLVPPASSNERNKFLKGNAEWNNVTWEDIVQNNPVSHNGVFRGKDLTNIYTLDQISAKLQNNDWSDLYIGDYITKTFENLEGVEETVDFVFADFDYWYGMGDTACNTHHILCVTRDAFAATAKMNNANTTEGGYPGSAMWTTLQEYYAKLNAANCLNSHILTHRDLIPSAVNTDVYSSGMPTAKGATYYTSSIWRNVTIGLMKEPMVYGSPVFSSSGFDTGCGKRQLSLFAFHHEFIKAGQGYGGSYCSWWLGAVSTVTAFCCVSSNGYAGYNGASYSGGVRPYLLLS